MTAQPHILNGSRVRDIREGCGMSRADLAEALGISRRSAAAVARIENEQDRVSRKFGLRIAEALGVFLSDITRHGSGVQPWPAPQVRVPPKSIPRPLGERLAEKIQVNAAGCWIWQCRINHGGYGEIKIGERRVKAHRVSYEHHVGPIPEGLDLDHLCRTRSCVNPAHLEPVTRQENIRRSFDARRRAA